MRWKREPTKPSPSVVSFRFVLFFVFCLFFCQVFKVGVVGNPKPKTKNSKTLTWARGELGKVRGGPRDDVLLELEHDAAERGGVAAAELEVEVDLGVALLSGSCCFGMVIEWEALGSGSKKESLSAAALVSKKAYIVHFPERRVVAAVVSSRDSDDVCDPGTSGEALKACGRASSLTHCKRERG